MIIVLNFIFRFFSFQCCYTWIWPSRFYECWLSKVLNSRINLLFMNKRRSKWSKHDTGVTHNNATELSKSPGSFWRFSASFSKIKGREPTQLIPKLFRTPWCVQYTNVKENKLCHSSKLYKYLLIFLNKQLMLKDPIWSWSSRGWGFKNGP